MRESGFDVPEGAGEAEMMGMSRSREGICEIQAEEGGL